MTPISLNYAEELHQAYESAAFAVRHLERVATNKDFPGLLKMACRQRLVPARLLAAEINELLAVVEDEERNRCELND